MKIAILGAGAMGSVFGGHLGLAGHDVTLVDVYREHMEAVARDGLDLRRPDGTATRVPLAATADPATLAPVDAVIVLVKAFATREAAASIRHAVGSDTWVATVQNGLGNDRALAEVFGPERVIPGTTTVGAQLLAPGSVLMTASTAAGASLTHLGPPRGAEVMPDGVIALAEALTGAGLPAKALDDADVVIWTKLCGAGTMAPVTAVLRRTLADTLEDPHSAAVLRELFDEVVAVAHAVGVPLDGEAVWQHCESTWRAAGPHVSSMAADVVAGRRTEIEAMCLEVARLGTESGVPTPVNATVGRLVRAIESSYDRAL
jgi:2-dehydropantoate 2-reductase